MVNLEYLLYDADLETVLREGARLSLALMLAVEGLKRSGSQPGEDDFDLLRDLAHDSRLLWARANKLYRGEAPAEPARMPSRDGRSKPPANVSALRVLRCDVDGDGDPSDGPPQGGNAS